MDIDKENIKIIKPFGPTILETICPEELFNELNSYTEEVVNDDVLSSYFSSKGKNIPNLLLRDFENIYLPKEYCDDIGFTEYVENLSKIYLDAVSEPNPNIIPELAIIPGGDPSFSLSKDILYADVWINRYFSGDFTPLHNHGGELSGVIFLKLSDELNEEQCKDRYSSGDFNYIQQNESLYHDHELPRRNNGNVNFVFGSSNKFSSGYYLPIQEERKVILFPSWLEHFVYPQRTNKERRSMSFNVRLFNQ